MLEFGKPHGPFHNEPAIQNGTGRFVLPFDQALYELYDRGEITYEDALSYADSPNDLRLMIKLASETDAEYLSHAADELSIQEDEQGKQKLF